jgi:hypothetical protein
MASICALSVGAAAAEPAAPAGMVKTLRGKVSVERAGQQQPAALGMAVFSGDRLRTGPESSVGVTLRDDTRLAAGPDSSLLISDFKFDATTQEGNLLVAMLKGTFNVITGLIAKQNPRNATFTTPTLSLGIRGTEFIVDVDEGRP